MKIDAARRRELINSLESAQLLEHKTSRFKGVVYGPNGTGKTVWSVGLLRKLLGPDSDIVFVDTNEGYESLRNHKSLLRNIIVVPYDNVEQLYVIAEMVYNKQGKYANVGGIIFDDADFMANMELTDLWHNRDASSTLDPDKPERPEYLKLQFRFNEVVDFILQKTPTVHLVMTCHDSEKKSKDGSVVLKTFPGFNPALAKDIAGRMLMVAYMTAKNVKGEHAEYVRELQVHPTTLVDAKSRVGCSKMKYEHVELIAHIAEWVAEGRSEDPEAEALRRDIATSKVTTADDLNLQGTEVEDDEPAFVE